MRPPLIGCRLAVVTLGAAAAGPLAPLSLARPGAGGLGPRSGDARICGAAAALEPDAGRGPERDLVVLEAVGPGAEARRSASTSCLPAGGFRAVLVGKDGGAKFTAAEPIPRQKRFDTIDAMPMRRGEIRGR